MRVNFEYEEYQLIKLCADKARCWPAKLVHDWIMQTIYRDLRSQQQDVQQEPQE